jgi:hypothetical protein
MYQLLLPLAPPRAPGHGKERPAFPGECGGQMRGSSHAENGREFLPPHIRDLAGRRAVDEVRERLAGNGFKCLLRGGKEDRIQAPRASDERSANECHGIRSRRRSGRFLRR